MLVSEAPGSLASAAANASERVWMAAVAAVATVAFATTMSSHVPLGDAPETVAGVASLGILHPPGYPVYVLAARLFSLVVPIGSLTFRVTLFSLVCSVLAVVATFRVARRLGASQPAAATGSLALGLLASFWFNSTFPKHYSFSALLGIGATVLALEWDARDDRRLLYASGAVFGLTFGASPQIGVLFVPAAVVVVLGQRHRSRFLRAVTLTVIAGVVTAAASLGYLMLRSAQDPAIAWGGATTPARVVDMLTLRDVAPLTQGFVAASSRHGQQTNLGPTEVASDFVGRVAKSQSVMVTESGLPILLLALWGAVAATRLAGRHQMFLVVGLFTNILGTAMFIDLRAFGSALTDQLLNGGFLIGVSFFVILLAALGLSDVLGRLWSWGRRPQGGHEGEAGESGGEADLASRPAGMVARLVAASLVGVVLIPAAVLHRIPASHRIPPFADDYARSVLSSLPRNAVLLAKRMDTTFPIFYRQVVKGERPDVTVVIADGLSAPWYRERVFRRLGVSIPHGVDLNAAVAAAITGMRSRGPVYLDMALTKRVRSFVGYRSLGMVSEVVDGPPGFRMVPSVEKVEEAVARAPSQGIYTSPARLRPPNTLLLSEEWAQAHWELARLRLATGDLAGAKRNLEQAHRVSPNDTEIAAAIAELEAGRSVDPVFLSAASDSYR